MGGRVHFPEQGSGRARCPGSDEARSFLLHIVFLVLLHAPADEHEQQCTQRLVAHLQTQVPVWQEEVGLMRRHGGLGPRAMGKSSTIFTVAQGICCQGRVCYHPAGNYFPHSFAPQARASRGVGTKFPIQWSSSHLEGLLSLSPLPGWLLVTRDPCSLSMAASL